MRVLITLLSIMLMAPAPLLARQEELDLGFFEPEFGLSIWTIVVFLLVLWVLWKFAWGPILGALDSRESGIRESIESARKMREEADSLLAEQRKELAEARRQAQEIVSEGREAGERVRKEIEEKARQESDRMLERARTEIERERDRALETIRTEAVDLALAAAERILAEKLDAETDRRLVEGYLRELDRPVVEA